MTKINAIMAISVNNCIGNNGELPWIYLKDDIKYFKEKTENNIVIMGNTTFQKDLKSNPLPNRVNIVLSKSREFKVVSPDLIYMSNAHSCLDLAKYIANERDKEIFIIGGTYIFDLFWDDIDIYYINYILDVFEGDTYFSPDYYNLELISKHRVENIIFTKYINKIKDKTK